MADEKPTGEVTQFGFRWGRAHVDRSWSHKGYVGLMIYTGRKLVNITITPSGQIRVGEVEKDWHK